jgi:tetratricopeptide (TPR) repeat protein
MDTAEIKKQILAAKEAERYDEAIELTSQLNWQKEPLDPEVAAAFLQSFYYKHGSDDDKSLKIADLFIDFYGKVNVREDFEVIKARIFEKRGDKYKKENNYQRAIELYETAFSWVRDGNYSGAKDRISKKKKEAESELKEKIEREKAARAARSALLSRSIDEFPELSSVVNILKKNGIETLRDLENNSNSELDSIKGIGGDKMSIIRSFKLKHNL